MFLKAEENLLQSTLKFFQSTSTLRGPLSKIHSSVFGRKNKFSSYFVYELDFGQY